MSKRDSMLLGMVYMPIICNYRKKIHIPCPGEDEIDF